MARNFGDLPGREVAVNVFDQLLALFAELIDLSGNIHRRLVLHVAQFFDFFFEFSHRRLEI